MNGYTLENKARYTPHYWRVIEPTVESLVDALLQLPAGTAIEVETGAEQVGDATSVTYWPNDKRAVIA